VASGGGPAGEMAVAGYGQAAAPADGREQVRLMVGVGAGQVTVRGDELGRVDTAPVSVAMLTKPASA
jgi:hypothetical protein